MEIIVVGYTMFTAIKIIIMGRFTCNMCTLIPVPVRKHSDVFDNSLVDAKRQPSGGRLSFHERGGGY